MSRARYHFWGILLLAILVGIFILSVRPALACEPESDYWFTEIFTLDEFELPENITLWADTAYDSQGVVYVANDSETPLYILPASSQALVDAADKIAEQAVYILEVNENKGKNIWKI